MILGTKMDLEDRLAVSEQDVDRLAQHHSVNICRRINLGGVKFAIHLDSPHAPFIPK